MLSTFKSKDQQNGMISILVTLTLAYHYFMLTFKLISQCNTISFEASTSNYNAYIGRKYSIGLPSEARYCVKKQSLTMPLIFFSIILTF